MPGVAHAWGAHGVALQRDESVQPVSPARAAQAHRGGVIPRPLSRAAAVPARRRRSARVLAMRSVSGIR